MRNVGKYHWALNFHGISLGNATTPVLFCGGRIADRAGD